jgi:excisionase family DNA binding protein
MKTQQKRMLTATEVAAWFGVNPVTIYRKARSGELPAIKFGKQWLFPEEAILAWIAAKSGELKIPETPEARPEVKGVGAFGRLPPLQLVYLFGSVASGQTTPLSDVDLAYLDDGSVKPFDLEVEIEEAARTVFKDASRIDLIRLNEAPLSVCAKVIRTGRLLYARADDVRVAFESKTTMEYLDYAPMLSQYYREVA